MASVGGFFYDLAAQNRRDSSRRTTVDSLKTLFLAALMSAAAYGVYVTVTAKPAAAPPKDAPKEWENPQVELPADTAAGAPGGFDALTGGPAPADAKAGQGATPPIGQSPPPFAGSDPSMAAPPSYPTTDPAGAAAPFSGDPAAAGAGRYPATDQLGANTPSADAASPYGETPGGQTTVPAGYDAPSQPGGAADARAEFVAAWEAAAALLDQNRLADAHLAFSEWYGNPALTPDDEAELLGLLDRLAGTVIYSRQHLLERPHEVQPGETLEQIAGLYEVPWELLANINGIRDPQRLRTGEQLKVIRGPFDALVELEKFRLTLFVQGRYAGRFKIGIGKDNATPEGEFEILQKIPNPAYYGDVVIDQNDPSNPLGEYMVDLGDKLMIHGTNEPQSIGRAESRGCIRLDNRDIKDVYEILSVKTDRSAGSKVTIRR